MTPQGSKVEHKAKNPRFRKIRYRLRTLLLSLFELKEDEIRWKMGEVDRDDSISYDSKRERFKELQKEEERLIINFSQSPINCSMCGNREEDLIYPQDYHAWICRNREECHQRVEQYAQKVRKMLEERDKSP